ncbi:esterase/lipase family protein [Dietzia sp.]|uniref:esterase/lipase family protein n=1 Tax=Dietzia sp. TaxID=1871616 RepID=UPI002FDB890D
MFTPRGSISHAAKTVAATVFAGALGAAAVAGAGTAAAAEPAPLGSAEVSASVQGSLMDQPENDPNLPIGEDPFLGPLPVPFNIAAGVKAALAPQVAPPGANDWNCKPSAEHPRPVVLVNPTVTTQALAFQAGAPLLHNAGYCVFTFNYGNVTPFPDFPAQALGDIPTGAQVLSDTVDRVLAASGAEQVDLVGHSQGGGIMPDYYLKELGGAEKVHTKVGISPSTGTSLSTLAFLRTLIPVLGPIVYGSIDTLTPASTQQVYDSEVSKKVYPDGVVSPAEGVENYAIVTDQDEVVTPYTGQFYEGVPEDHNILLQDGCVVDRSEHVSTMYNERAWRHVLNSLDPERRQGVPCFPVAPFAPWVK